MLGPGKGSTCSGGPRRSGVGPPEHKLAVGVTGNKYNTLHGGGVDSGRCERKRGGVEG